MSPRVPLFASPAHPPVSTGRVGVLLTNLGTPDKPTPSAVRRYLDEFLSDPRVVELPPILWQPILRLVILTTRPYKSARLYGSVWDKERDDSPLRLHLRDQAHALDTPALPVRYAMRYGKPSIPAELKAMKDEGIDRILVAPLYPQYCAATTASALDKVYRTLEHMRWQPAIRTLPPYFDDPTYLDIMAEDIRDKLERLPFRPDLVIASFHGMPRRTLDKGDPYHCHCAKTARLIGERLAVPVKLTFQSRFGAAEWLKPYTEDVLERLPRDGVKKVAVIAPAFSSDCLETLEELNIRGREGFLHAGGDEFAYLPCLNATPRGIRLLRHLINRELAGWGELPVSAGLQVAA
ncbi:MAG: ferrochelatase [Sphingomonadaceae bacterium]|nr:ferrochelatase [Sphingomonadaceae bacterium]